MADRSNKDVAEQQKKQLWAAVHKIRDFEDKVESILISEDINGTGLSFSQVIDIFDKQIGINLCKHAATYGICVSSMFSALKSINAENGRLFFTGKLNESTKANMGFIADGASNAAKRREKTKRFEQTNNGNQKHCEYLTKDPSHHEISAALPKVDPGCFSQPISGLPPRRMRFVRLLTEVTQTLEKTAIVPTGNYQVPSVVSRPTEVTQYSQRTAIVPTNYHVPSVVSRPTEVTQYSQRTAIVPTNYHVPSVVSRPTEVTQYSQRTAIVPTNYHVPSLVSRPTGVTPISQETPIVPTDNCQVPSVALPTTVTNNTGNPPRSLKFVYQKKMAGRQGPRQHGIDDSWKKDYCYHY